MQYTDKDKLNAVNTWLVLGKVPLVAAATGVSEHTIRAWKMQPWWKEMVANVQNESNQQLDSKLTKILDKALDVTEDRIENGEYILDSKTGKIVRLPVKIKDAHRVAVDLIGQRDLVRGKPEREKQEQQTSDILKKLADQFSDWVKVNMKQPRIIEGEASAVHDEREARLQEGVQQVSLTPEAESQPQPEEQSPSHV